MRRWPAKRGAVWLLLVVCCGAAAHAATPPEQLDELVVTGERAGPGMWHVYRDNAHLWILGTLSPLPKAMTWRSTQLEGLLDHADRLLVSKLVDISAPRAVWLLLTQRKLLLAAGGKARLKDVMPPPLYQRFALQRARFTRDTSKWEKYRPMVAATFLQEDAFEAAGLSTRLDLAEEVRTLARKHHVRIDEFKVTGWRDVLDTLKSIPPATEDTCVAASLAVTESGVPRLIARAKAWATGDVERLQQLPEPPELTACRDALTTDAADLYQQLRRTWLANLETQLQLPGTTVAAVNMDLLLGPDGFLETLRRRGFHVEAP